MRIQFAWVCAGLMMGGFAFAQKPQGTNKPAVKAATAQESDESAGWKNQGGMAGNQETRTRRRWVNF